MAVRRELRRQAMGLSQKAFERMVSLPLYTAMSDADVERVIAAVRGLLA